LGLEKTKSTSSLGIRKNEPDLQWGFIMSGLALAGTPNENFARFNPMGPSRVAEEANWPPMNADERRSENADVVVLGWMPTPSAARDKAVRKNEPDVRAAVDFARLNTMGLAPR